jgi:hypothetical protein
MSLVPASSFVSAGQRFAVLAYEQTVPDRLLRLDRAQMSKTFFCVYLLKAIRIKYRAPCCLHATHSLHLKRSIAIPCRYRLHYMRRKYGPSSLHHEYRPARAMVPRMNIFNSLEATRCLCLGEIQNPAVDHVVLGARACSVAAQRSP